MRNHLPIGAHYPGLRFTIWAWVWVWSVALILMVTKGCVG